jgi:hypothetical protein
MNSNEHMSHKVDLSKYISEKDLCKKWKCHWVTLKNRSSDGYLTFVIENGQRYYPLSDVANTERLKPVRAYLKSKNTRAPQSDKIVNSTKRKAKAAVIAQEGNYEPATGPNVFSRLLLSLRRLFTA